MRKILLTLGGVAALLLALACGGTGPTVTGGGEAAKPAATAAKAAGPKGFKVGQHATLTLANGSSADIVVESVKPRTTVFVATITIQCTAGSMDYNPYEWSMVDGDGLTLDSGVDINVTNELHSGTLAAGQKVTGVVQWAGAGHKLTGGRVVYGQLVGDLAYWTIP